MVILTVTSTSSSHDSVCAEYLDPIPDPIHNKLLHLKAYLRIASKADFATITIDLATSARNKDRNDFQSIAADWQRARNRMWTELVSKLAYFQQLPHKLLQLGHADPYEVVLGAKACLHLWQLGGPGCHHRQSRRFLDPSYDGGESDPPLRSLVERLSRGESMLGSADFQPLVRWVARFCCIRVAERSVEGVHAIVTRTYKRAPHAAIPYISIELRFRDFWDAMATDPPVPCFHYHMHITA